MAKIRFVLLLSFLPFLFIGLGWLFTRSSLFQFSEIEFTNDIRPDLKERVIAQLAPQLGNNMFALSMGSLNQGLRALPHFKNIRLRKKLPSTLIVQVDFVEIHALEWRDGKLWQLGESCEPIEPMGVPMDLPLVEFAQGISNESKLQLCQWLASMKSRNLQTLDWKQLTKISLNMESGLEIATELSPTQIHLGYDQWLQNVILADKTLAKLSQNGLIAEAIDSSFGTRSVVTLPSSINRLNLSKLVRRETEIKKSVKTSR